MPWTMAAFAVGALSMIGLPPTAGFVSKWFILSGAIASGQWAAAAVIVVGTLLTAGYFLPIVYRAFFRPAPDVEGHGHGEAPATMVVAQRAATSVQAEYRYRNREQGDLQLRFFPNDFHSFSYLIALA
jgi:multicomponent Na+:H+ antiporter subunit D